MTGKFVKGAWVPFPLGDPNVIGDVMYDLKRYVESTYKFDCITIDLQHINYLTYHSTSEHFMEYVIQLKLYKGLESYD